MNKGSEGTKKIGRLSAAIYARYSSDLRRLASIRDQVRTCREAAMKKGWRVKAIVRERGTSPQKTDYRVLGQEAPKALKP